MSDWELGAADGSPLDVPAAARALGTKQSAIRKAIARGTLRAETRPTPKGWKYVIRPEELARYLRENRTVRK